MSDITLFDLDVVEDTWSPVWEKRIEDFGWHWSDPDPKTGRLPLHEDGTQISKPEWNEYLASGRCRDCGVKCQIDMGGGTAGHSFRICKGCALLDGDHHDDEHTTTIERRPGSMGFSHLEESAHCLTCGWFMFTVYWDDNHDQQEFTPEQVLDACGDHERPHHRGRWGASHEIGDCEKLHRERAERRARYLTVVSA